MTLDTAIKVAVAALGEVYLQDPECAYTVDQYDEAAAVLSRFAEELPEAEPKVVAALQEVFLLCKGKQFRMRIPVDESDSDRVICAGLEAIGNIAQRAPESR